MLCALIYLWVDDRIDHCVEFNIFRLGLSSLFIAHEMSSFCLMELLLYRGYELYSFGCRFRVIFGSSMICLAVSGVLSF